MREAKKLFDILRQGESMSVESCSLSMACDMEVCSECSRKMQDKEETTSEASWTAVTKVKKKNRCGGWNQRVKRKGLKPQFRGTGRKASA